MSHLGVARADILLPGPDISYEKWAVIACDQFTHSREYWDAVNTAVGQNPSTLHLSLPEIDLEELDARLSGIHAHMHKYRSEVLTRAVNGLVLVRRKRAEMTRWGVLLCADLDEYDYTPTSRSLIRASEGTILERLPPRARIRRNAEIECPHAMLLLDDPALSVIEPLKEWTDRLPLLYDFDLMMDGGHITGWLIENEQDVKTVFGSLEALVQPQVQREKYAEAATSPILFAVGDGNHSLAAAKACWEEIRQGLSEQEAATHPARYALVEVVNLHSDALVFEPIHRVIYGVETDDALRSFAGWLSKNTGDSGEQHFIFTNIEGHSEVCAPRAPHMTQTGTLQLWLDEYLRQHPTVHADYIHGEKEALEISSRPGNIAALLGVPKKEDLFATILRHGALPRKAFSMGDARDKRYYLECRALVKG